MVQAACGTDAACGACPVNLLVEGAERALCGDSVRQLTLGGSTRPTVEEASAALGRVGMTIDDPRAAMLNRATRAGVVVALSDSCNRRLVD